MQCFELINWLNTHIHNDYLIFDKIIYIESLINNFLKRNNLELNETNDIFLMRFIVYLYLNSNCKNNLMICE